MKQFAWTGGLALLLVAAMFWSGCETGTEFEDRIGRKVAVYNGYGAWDSSAVAIMECINDAGLEAEFLDHNQMQASLDGFGVVIIGAGNPEQIASVLGFTGTQRILALVERGGGYIGLGAGAYLAGDSMSFQQRGTTDGTIGLYEGYAWGPRADQALLPGYTITNLTLSLQYFNPETRRNIETLYYGGATPVIYRPINAEPIAWFSSNDVPAAFRFGVRLGSVVLASFLPEIEENDARDGSDWGDGELIDNDSEWFWLQEAALWTLRNIPQ